MTQAVLGVLVALAMVEWTAGANWAVLVAGSNGYGNYRHQADVCHAYQVLTKGGVSPENVITMAYDDIAGSEENPFPGKVFNKPTGQGTPGVDVYAGCKIDYTKGDVTPEKFMAVLTGDAEKAGGKVLKSTGEDRVFVNFVDHGGVGIIAFPEGKLLHATELQTALKTMHSSNMYKELVFYMEACESGSMFDGFPTDLNIYVTTAANAQESSWGTYCPPDDNINGKSLNTCLGDLYSVNWMENADANNLQKETLEEQFEKVKKLTNKSHVMQYGAQGIASEPAANFEGRGGTGKNTTQAMKRGEVSASSAAAVDSRDIGLVTLFYQYIRSGSAAKAQELIADVQGRLKADVLFARILKTVGGGRTIPPATRLTHKHCHEAGHRAVVRYCGGYTDYSLKHSHIIVDLCEALGGDATHVVNGVHNACQ